MIDLRLGDGIAGMAALPDRSIDHVITDPPYSDFTHGKIRRGGSVHAPDRTDGGPKRAVISSSVALGFVAITQDEREAAADQFARVVRRWVLVFCDVESAHLWRGALASAGLDYVRTMAWIKVGAAPQFTGDRPAAGFEAIVLAHPKGRKRWNAGGKLGVYRVPVARGLKAAPRIHKTQKPLRLMEELIADFTAAGETILDPYAGGGTTLAAAHALGRSAIGWELDAPAHALATERLRALEAAVAA